MNAGADAETPHATAQALQRKLVEYLRTVKKSDEQKDAEKSVTDQDARYFKCLAQVRRERREGWEGKRGGSGEARQGEARGEDRRGQEGEAT